MTVTIPILQVRQPWAWAYCAGKIKRHGVDRADDYRGPRAIISSKTKSFLPQAIAWMRENGMDDVPRPSRLPIGALVGFVWSDGCCGRAELSADEVAMDDDRRFFLRLAEPLAVAGVVRPFWPIERGLSIDDAIQFAASARGVLPRQYADLFRAIARGESVEGLQGEAKPTKQQRRNFEQSPAVQRTEGRTKRGPSPRSGGD